MKKKVVIESLDAENRRLWKQLEAKWQRVRDLETELAAAQSRITELEEVEKDWSVINGELAEATLRNTRIEELEKRVAALEVDYDRRQADS